MVKAESAGTSRRKLDDILGALDKAYGKVQVLPTEPPLDQAIYLILRENWDYRKAIKSLHVLQREFVDWNEVRVSTIGELHDHLVDQGDKDLDVKIEKIKTLLINLYRERNCAHLNFLSEEGDTEAQLKFLGYVGVLTVAQQVLIVQSLTPIEEYQVPQGVIRTLSRIGAIPRVQSPAAARKHLDKMLDPEKIYTFLSHLTHHGEEICLSKSPRCGECAVVSLCGFKRKVGVA